MKFWTLTIILALLSGSGCTEPNPPTQQGAEAMHPSYSTTAAESSTTGPAKAQEVNRTEPQGPVWASLDDAAIRPGTGIAGAGDGCTVAFVFVSSDNRTVYLSTAAHCILVPEPIAQQDPEICGFPAQPLGTPVTIQGASNPGRLAYSSFGTMNALNETDRYTCAHNDFALVEVHPADWNKIHPATSIFGGPTGLADSTTAQPGDRVLSYGNSYVHNGMPELERREGYVTAPCDSHALPALDPSWTVCAYWLSPAFFGDSGSPVLNAMGQALAVLVGFASVPPGGMVATRLDVALAYAETHAGITIELATWDVLDEGLLPDLPVEFQR